MASLRHPRRQLGDAETMLGPSARSGRRAAPSTGAQCTVGDGRWCPCRRTPSSASGSGSMRPPRRGRSRRPCEQRRKRPRSSSRRPGTRRPRVRLPRIRRTARQRPRTNPCATRCRTSGRCRPRADPGPGTSRRDRIVAQLASILSELSGIEPTALDPKASFADLGFDSLFLTQANAQFRKRFGVRITFRQIFEEAPSIDSLAGFIDGKLAPDALAAPEPAVAPQPQVEPQPQVAPQPHVAPEPAAASSATASPVTLDQESVASVTERSARGAVEDQTGSPVERLIREQLRIMEQQLELMRGGDRARISAAAAPATPQAATPQAATPQAAAPTPSEPVEASAATAVPLAAGPAEPQPAAAAPAVPTKGHYLATRDQGHRPGSRVLTDGQQAAIAALVRRADARTPGSKQLAQQWRAATRRQPRDRRVRSSVEGARLPDRRAALERIADSGTSTATSTSTRPSASARTCSAIRRTSWSTPCASSSAADSRSASRATSSGRSARWRAR